MILSQRLILAVALLPVLACGCGKPPIPALSSDEQSLVSHPSLPEFAPTERFADEKKSGCLKGIEIAPAWKTKSREEIVAWLGQYGVTLVKADIEQKYLAQFAAEFVRIPEVFRKAVHDASGDIHLLQGTGVTEDPSWGTEVNTFDGRAWSSVPGAGGYPYLSAQGSSHPARFVVNRLYEGHGSINLVFHEFAHSLDSIRSSAGISGGKGWLPVAHNDAAFRAAIGSRCKSYCTDHPDESFAEGFALYYSCDSTREWLKGKAANAAQWLGNLAETIKVDSGS